MRSYTEELSPTPVANAPMSAGADFGIRLLARAVDILYGYILAFVMGFVGVILFMVLSEMGMLRENWLEALEQETTGALFWGILGAFLYHGFSEGVGGTTIGKLICGLNVAQEDGRPCTFIGGLKRGLVYHADALFFGLVAYSSMKYSALRQRYGDIWGKTVVVKKSVYRPTPARPVWRILAGLALGSLAWMAVLFWPMWMQVR
jgi:uncharacterized RDD family membrane protein YckC